MQIHHWPVPETLGVCAAEGFRDAHPELDLSEPRRSDLFGSTKMFETLEIDTFRDDAFCRADS